MTELARADVLQHVARLARAKEMVALVRNTRHAIVLRRALAAKRALMGTLTP